MRIAFAVFLVVHGAIHLIGCVKAFGLGEVARLQQPISRPMGVVWLGAALAFVASAVLLVVVRRQFWVAALPAVVLSQVAILASWGDAKLGTIANAVVLVPLALSMLDLRASSLRSRYDHEVRQALAGEAPAPPPITEADLAPLPPLVQTWLRRAGVVGRPRVRNFHAVFRAEMRNGPDATWMPAIVEQYNFYDPPARLFFMEASRFGVPFDAFHRYVGPAATFEVRLAGLVDVVDARGPEMNQGETVTMLNDLCFLAPAAVVGAPLSWQPVDERRVKATFSNAGQTISAVLSFDGQGDLVGFVSGDRYQSDGKTHRLLPWSTPLGDFHDFGGARLPRAGEARWQEPRGEWTYIRVVLQRIDYNVTRARAPGA